MTPALVTPFTENGEVVVQTTGNVRRGIPHAA